MSIRIGSDDSERRVLADIAQYGWLVLNIMEEGNHPPWTFTIGLQKTWQHPEFIIVCLKKQAALHLSRSQTRFPAETARNTLENSDLKQGRGRALHLSRFSTNSLISSSFFKQKNRRPVTSLPPNRYITSAEALHHFRGGVASLRENAIYPSNFNTLRDPPVSPL